MTKEQKEWIDSADYESLLKKWRFAPTNDWVFLGECGKYYFQVMTQKCRADPEGAKAAGKKIGWESGLR